MYVCVCVCVCLCVCVCVCVWLECNDFQTFYDGKGSEGAFSGGALRVRSVWVSRVQECKDLQAFCGGKGRR